MLLNFCKGNQVNQLILRTIILSLCVVVLPTSVKAEDKDNNSAEGLPTYRVGGGSRGGCITDNRQLTALIPENTIGKTATTSPKLFFYIPETNEADNVALEFVLRDRQDNLVYETLLKTNHQSGIIGIDLPNSLKSNDGKTKNNYHWYLSMICNPHNRSYDVVVEGWIQKVELQPNIEQKLQFSQPLQKAKIYQQEGMWYDALSTLAKQKQTANSQPEIATNWTNLLQSVGLINLAQEEFIESYQVSKSLK
jgi:hypothetical protein